MLYLPKGKSVEIELKSRDVIHSFWVIDFLYKKDMIPGKTNYEYFTPDEGGHVRGQVRRALRRVPLAHALQREGRLARPQYQDYLASLRKDGNVGDLGDQYNQNTNNPTNTAPVAAGADEHLEQVRQRSMSSATATRPATGGQASGQNFNTTRVGRKGNVVVRWITSTDHKVLGYLYLITSFMYFLVGGVMALVIRAQLFEPGLSVVATKEQYNQLFTMHGTIMLLLFATPLFSGFANAVMPLQIGAPDVAFPRLNGFAFWLYFFGALVVMAGFLTPQGAASFGWFAYAPLSDTTFTPGLGGNLWVFGLALTGFSTILGAVNFITTIITMRAPGMTMFRMPIFTWNTLVTSILVIMAFPVLAAALFGLGVRPSVRRQRLQSGQRRRDPLAAPVLVLRAPRGVHHRAAVLRHRLRGLPGLQP